MTSYKKWYTIFLSVFLAVLIAFGAFNFIIDPFGAFGDKYLNMYDYDMFKNIRIAKISYLEKKYNDFDSYIIGGSKAGALLPEIIEKYYPGSHFYNLNMIGGKFYDYEHTIYYIVNNYNVKNIVFQISQLEANQKDTSDNITGMLHGKIFSGFPIAFYVKTLFQSPVYSFKKLQAGITKDTSASGFYNIKTGSYNYDRAEKQIKSNPDSYFNKKSLFPDSTPKVKNTVFDYNLEVLARIVSFCDEKGVNLLLITAPTYTTEINSYPLNLLEDYLKQIAGVNSYWNFSGYNSINNDRLNFYNNNHYRLKISEMMMARIFNNKTVQIPDDFGTYITSENADKLINEALIQHR